MNMKQVLVVAGVGLVSYWIANKYFTGSRLNTAVARNLGTNPGSQQTRMLIEQCGGWDECLAGLTGAA